jgi:hypothetical protein
MKHYNREEMKGKIKKDTRAMRIHNELNLIVCFFLWTYPYDELIIGVFFFQMIYFSFQLFRCSMLHFYLVFFLVQFHFISFIYLFCFICNMLTQFLIFQSMFSIVLGYGEGIFLILKF